MKTLLRKLSWRLIVIHFLAIWLFMDAFRAFAILYDYNFLRVIEKAYTIHWTLKEITPIAHIYPDLGIRLEGDDMRLHLLTVIGLFGAFLLSLAITLKMKWFWLNSVIAFIAAFLILKYYRSIPGKYDLIHYIGYIKYIFPDKLNSIWEFGATAAIALILGILLLFSPIIIRFIDKVHTDQWRSIHYFQQLKIRLWRIRSSINSKPDQLLLCVILSIAKNL